MNSSSAQTLPRIAPPPRPAAARPAPTPPARPPAPPPPAGRDFATIYRATLSPLRRYLSRLLGNSAEAQDIAHDAYLRVFPSISQSSTDQPEALLYVTARRLAINRLKRRSISPIHPGEANYDSAASASPSVVPVPCSVLAAVDPEEAFVAALFE